MLLDLKHFLSFYYRKNKISMDELVLHSTWQSRLEEGNLTLTGLLIEGATFNGNNLVACAATSENVNVVPDCCITWIRKASADINQS